MFEPIYRRTLEELANKPNETKIVNQPWSTQYDPNRVNDPTYMGGLMPQQIQRAGVYKPIQTEDTPRPPQRDRRVFMKAPKPVYTEPQEEPRLKIKRKPVFETLFED
jgi:hypothetical protein